MIKKELKLLLSKNKTQKVIDKLLSMTEIVNDNAQQYNEVILLSSRYQSYLEAKRAGTLGFEEDQLQFNRVNSTLIQIIEALPDTARQTAPNKPVKKEDKVIELLIDQNFHDFDYSKKENLIGVIAGLLNIGRQEVLIRRVSMGSIKVAIEMPGKKAAAFLMLFDSGISDPILKEKFNIRSVTLKTWLPGTVVSLNALWLAAIGIVGVAGIVFLMILYNQNSRLKNQLIIENSKNNRDNNLINDQNTQTDSLILTNKQLRDSIGQLLEVHREDEATIKKLLPDQGAKDQIALLRSCDVRNADLQIRLKECNFKLGQALKSGSSRQNKKVVDDIKNKITEIETQMLPKMNDPKFSSDSKKLNALRIQINENLASIMRRLNRIQ